MNTALIGLDLGTTGCKAAVFNERLHMLGEAYIEYPLIRISSLEIEQDANLWWDLAKQAVKIAIRNSGILPGAVKGMGVSSQGISFVPVDSGYRQLRNAISWLDGRAVMQRDSILDNFTESDIFRMTGKRPSECYVLPKLLWLRENEPKLYDRTHKFLMALDYITAKLCGECITDHTMASGTLLYDVTGRQWSPLLLESFGIDLGRLPAICRSGSSAGIIQKDVAMELGIPMDVVLAVGGQDQKCAALGAGIGDGIATVSLGTASAIEQLCNRPVLDGMMRIPCFSGLFDGEWVIEGCVATAGAAVKWLRETFFRDKSYDELGSMAGRCAAGAGGVFFYPHLAGAGTLYRMNMASGVFHGITLSTDADQIVRSVFEGIAYQIKANLDVMQELHQPAREIRLFGGGAKSAVWGQIIADVTGKAVTTLYTPETANAGAALLAGLACGVFGGASEAADAVQTAGIFEPRALFTGQYDHLYHSYLDIQSRLLD